MENRLANPANEATLPRRKLAADFRELIDRVETGAVQRAKAADQVVRTHPYQSLGLALGIGALAGVLIGRRWHS
jgi:ElaB/YqjD/DUF883 family membrane-anchored ribosome-binding protein